MTIPISIAIPTYCREQVLLDTLGYLLALDQAPAEILVLDQTEQHEPATVERLTDLNDAGKIRWIRLVEPSIPQAMNRGLLEATNEIVLFVDDDIRPEPQLVVAHHAEHDAKTSTMIAGRVIQPWDEGCDFCNGPHSEFAGLKACTTLDFIGCNFSVNRLEALALGGFDENFVRVAYRFEAEFAHRWRASGRRIYFSPDACLHHLKDMGGGTRTYGEHLTTSRPDHAVGAYYYSLRTANYGEFLKRPFRAVATRHHLRRPWWIPLTLIAELRGMLWAALLFGRGPKYAGRPIGSINV
jgi:GT2 family glycosyltransferase